MHIYLLIFLLNNFFSFVIISLSAAAPVAVHFTFYIIFIHSYDISFVSIYLVIPKKKPNFHIHSFHLVNDDISCFLSVYKNFQKKSKNMNA